MVVTPIHHQHNLFLASVRPNFSGHFFLGDYHSEQYVPARSPRTRRSSLLLVLKNHLHIEWCWESDNAFVEVQFNPNHLHNEYVWVCATEVLVGEIVIGNINHLLTMHQRYQLRNGDAVPFKMFKPRDNKHVLNMDNGLVKQINGVVMKMINNDSVEFSWQTSSALG